MVNTNFSEDVLSVLRQLQQSGVEFLIIGGFAVGIHGFTRNTSDIDVWIGVSEQNLANLAAAVVAFGQSTAMASEFVQYLQQNKFARVPYDGGEFHFDLLTHVKGLDWAQSYANSLVIQDRDVTLRYISFEDLIASKRAAKRPQDATDVKNLLAGRQS